MKKYLILLIIFIFFPLLAFAAYNDVTLQTSADISVNGITFDVSGSDSEIESMTVNAGDFTVTLQSGSTFTVTSDNKATFLVHSPGGVSISRPCTSVNSQLTLSGGDGVTVTVTPISDACDSTSTTGSGSSSSPSGGGGSASAPGVFTSSTQTQQTAVVAQNENIVTASPIVIPTSAPAISNVFTNTLRKDMSNADIKRLQQLLNSDTDTQIAASGAGSPGNETNYFGSLTEKAVQKFQLKYGVVSSGTSDTTGYGLVGPATRAKLAEVFGTIAEPVAPSVASPSAQAVSVSPVFSSGLSIGMENADIKRLQQLLNSDTDTQVAASGVGSPGNETNYFGSLTEKAVQKFQLKYGVAGQGDQGYGYIGPKTRTKLGEIFGGAKIQQPVVPASTPTSSSAEETALKAQLNSLTAQLEDMMRQLQEAQGQ